VCVLLMGAPYVMCMEPCTLQWLHMGGISVVKVWACLCVRPTVSVWRWCTGNVVLCWECLA
jgi:hypothetical protein